MSFFNAESIPVSRYQETGEVDRYGDPVSAWAPADPIRAGVSDKATEIQFSPGRVEMDFDYALYLEAGQTVLPADLLTVRGQSCKVVKPHFEWQGLFSRWQPGSTVYVKAEVG